MNEHGDVFSGTTGGHLAASWSGACVTRVHSSWSRLKDFHGGVWLWLFAAIAQRSAPFSRWVFHSVAGGRNW
jgi:hypothetical protein